MYLNNLRHAFNFTVYSVTLSLTQRETKQLKRRLFRFHLVRQVFFFSADGSASLLHIKTTIASSSLLSSFSSDSVWRHFLFNHVLLNTFLLWFYCSHNAVERNQRRLQAVFFTPQQPLHFMMDPLGV